MFFEKENVKKKLKEGYFMESLVEIMKKVYLRELKNEFELYYDEPINNNDVLQIVVNTIATPSNKIKYKKDGYKKTAFKDIPVNDCPVELIVLKQRFCNLDTKETFTLPLDCVLMNHRMTKRLANYALNELGMNSFNKVSKDTRISKRTLHYLFKEWMNKIEPTWETQSVYIFSLSDENDTYVIMDVKQNAIKITKNIQSLIQCINKYGSQKVIAPSDEKLCVQLKLETKTDVVVDYFDFKNYVEKQVWKCYEKKRQNIIKKASIRKTKPDIKTNLIDEYNLFFKERYSLSDDELIQLNHICNDNSLYDFYYNAKDNLVLKVQPSKVDCKKKPTLSLSYTTIFKPEDYEVLPLLPIRDKRINEIDNNIDILLEQGIHFNEELSNLRDYRHQYKEEYNKLKNELTTSQFILRWNSEKQIYK